METGLRIKDCLIILLATILIATTALVIIKTLLINESLAEFLGYTIGMGLSAVFAIRTYKQKANEFKVEIGSTYLKYIPLLIIWPILLVFGITSHLIYVIPTPDFLTDAFKPSENNIFWLSLFTVALIAPVLEEIIFRGIILKGLLCQYSPAKAIVVSSIIFGLVHLNPWQFLGAFGIGIISGWIYWRTKNLLLPIIMHISNNLFFFLFGRYFGTSYLIDTPMQQVFGSQFNQALAVGLSILLFVVIWFLLSNRIRYQELKNTSHNIA